MSRLSICAHGRFWYVGSIAASDIANSCSLDQPIDLHEGESWSCEDDGAGNMAYCQHQPSTSSCQYLASCHGYDDIVTHSSTCDVNEYCWPWSVSSIVFCSSINQRLNSTKGWNTECMTYIWPDDHVTGWWCGPSAGTFTLARFASVTTDSETSTSSNTSKSKSSSSDNVSTTESAPTRTATPTLTAADAEVDANSTGMRTDVLAGSIAGTAVAIFAIVGIAVWIWKHRKTVKENSKRVSSFGPNFVVHNVTRTGGPGPHDTPRDAVEKDATPARVASPTPQPADQPPLPSRGTDFVVSPISSPSPSPGPRDNAHLSTAISSLNSQDNARLSTQHSASSLRAPVYKSFSSDYLQQLPSMSDPPSAQNLSNQNGTLGESWFRDSMMSGMPGTSSHSRDSPAVELMGDVPDGGRQNKPV